MPTNPELVPIISHYSQQRLLATHEANRPKTGPVGRILTAIVAENHYSQTKCRYQESDWLWANTRERLIDTDPAARAAKERCRQITTQIQELENFPGVKWTDKIAGLRVELEEAGKPYTKAASRTSNNPELQQAVIDREQNRHAMREAKQNLDQARHRALTEINQNLPIGLTWSELEEILGSGIKQELKVVELRLLSATIDRQEAVAAANQVLKTSLGKIRSGQTAAIRIRNLKNGQV